LGDRIDFLLVQFPSRFALHNVVVQLVLSHAVHIPGFSPKRIDAPRREREHAFEIGIGSRYAFYPFFNPHQTSHKRPDHGLIGPLAVQEQLAASVSIDYATPVLGINYDTPVGPTTT
jgi:hypothetical protein